MLSRPTNNAIHRQSDPSPDQLVWWLSEPPSMCMQWGNVKFRIFESSSDIALKDMSLQSFAAQNFFLGQNQVPIRTSAETLQYPTREMRNCPGVFLTRFESLFWHLALAWLYMTYLKAHKWTCRWELSLSLGADIFLLCFHAHQRLYLPSS